MYYSQDVSSKEKIYKLIIKSLPQSEDARKKEIYHPRILFYPNVSTELITQVNKKNLQKVTRGIAADKLMEGP